MRQHQQRVLTMLVQAALVLVGSVSAFLVPPPVGLSSASRIIKHEDSSNCNTRRRSRRLVVSATTLEEDQMNDFRQMVQQYNEARQRKEEAEQKALSEQQQGGARGGLVGTLREATASEAYTVAEGGVVVLLVALLHAAWSGGWSSSGVITYATEESLRQATLAVLGAHVALAGLSGFVCWARERGDFATVAINVARTFVVGGLDFVRVALLEDKSEIEEREMASQPPLSMEVSTFQMQATKAMDGVLLSTSIRTLPGKEVAMRKLLVKLGDAAREFQQGSGAAVVSTMAINQDPTDRRNFLMLQRFPSLENMSKYQASAPFKDFVASSESLLSEPFGLYIANERKGRLAEANYPFGPGGEGGRDDAIYSSPSNLDGSQSGTNRIA